jgi:tRNA(Arg) A34 adenosine deaminase TadA
MEEAARLARESVERNEGGPFGAVVVQRYRIVGASGNQVLLLQDPTAHAELLAIRQACRALGRFHLEDCEIFTTCEPCPMCLGAIHWARIAMVHFALDRQDAARIGFDDAAFHAAMQAPTVPLERVACEPAEEAFRLWESKPRRGY